MLLNARLTPPFLINTVIFVASDLAFMNRLRQCRAGMCRQKNRNILLKSDYFCTLPQRPTVRWLSIITATPIVVAVSQAIFFILRNPDMVTTAPWFQR